MTKRKLKRIYKMTDEQFDRYIKRIGTMEDGQKIVTWFLTKGNMSAQKLVCLCYFTYVWGLIILKRKVAPFEFLRKEDILLERTINSVWGINETVYRSTLIRPELDEKLEKLLTLVYNSYGQLDEDVLLERIRTHTPFKNADPRIRPQEIYTFFSLVALS